MFNKRRQRDGMFHKAFGESISPVRRGGAGHVLTSDTLARDAPTAVKAPGAARCPGSVDRAYNEAGARYIAAALGSRKKGTHRQPARAAATKAHPLPPPQRAHLSLARSFVAPRVAHGIGPRAGHIPAGCSFVPVNDVGEGRGGLKREGKEGRKGIPPKPVLSV